MIIALGVVGLALGITIAGAVVWDANVIARASRLATGGQHRQAVKLCLQHLYAVPSRAMDDVGARGMAAEIAERNLRLARLARDSAAVLSELNQDVQTLLDAILDEMQVMQRVIQGGEDEAERSAVVEDWYKRWAKVIEMSNSVRMQI
jgi:hypothetical protein